jgi:hypothetical protein
MITIEGEYTEGGGSYQFVCVIVYHRKRYVRHDNRNERVFIKDGDVLRPVDNCKAFALYKRT